MSLEIIRHMMCVSYGPGTCNNDDCPHVGLHPENPLCKELCHSCGGTCHYVGGPRD